MLQQPGYCLKSACQEHLKVPQGLKQYHQWIFHTYAYNKWKLCYEEESELFKQRFVEPFVYYVNPAMFL